MRETRSLWNRWEEAFLELFKESPYVGPRPQTQNDVGMLVGRDAEIKRVARAVLDRQLVIIDGYSGTGKSSLLANGVFARLKTFGFTVFPISSWGGLKQAAVSDIDVFISREIKVELKEEEKSICRALDKQYGESAVLVLDQFEEMLREQEQPLRSAMAEWIVSSINQYRIHIVISLRTDSIHRLEPLLRGVRPFSQERVHIEELTLESDIRSIITQTQSKYSSEMVIRPKAADQLWKLWSDENNNPPPLLCLQACLFALFFRAQDDTVSSATTSPSRMRDRDIVPIGVKHIDDLKKDHKRFAAGQNFFFYALRDAVRARITQAERAAREADWDKYLVEGTCELVKRMAPLLSSGDHRVPISFSELAYRVLDDELRVLQGALLEKKGGNHERAKAATREDQYKLVAKIFKSVRAGRVRSSRQGSREAVPRDVTAGPMMGKTAKESLQRELERVVFAVKWLIDLKLLREDNSGILLLIHDGAGAALNAWANAANVNPLSATRRLTGSRGERFNWGDNPLQGEEGKKEDPDFLINLNWRECRITASIRHVVFVNCDFTASKFDNCTLEGVTFINCILDDANFEKCRIVGEARLRLPRENKNNKEGVIQLAPSFMVEAPSEAKNFARYLKPQKGEVFFSDMAGEPASLVDNVPIGFQGEMLAKFVAPQNLNLRADHGALDQINRDVPPVEGGVAIVGGRICFLTLYQCYSDEVKEDKGALAFHRVAGGGLDIVDFSGTINICDAAVRGISVSADTKAQNEPVLLKVRDSLVVNTCFSQSLNGSAIFDNCIVFALLNANKMSGSGGKGQDFTVILSDCRYQFIANAEVKNNSKEDSTILPPDKDFFRRPYFKHVNGTDSVCTLQDQELLALMLEAMDFRSRPEEWDRRQRQLCPGRNARSLLRKVEISGETSSPRGREWLKQAECEYKTALSRLAKSKTCSAQYKRAELTLRGEAALVGYLLLDNSFEQAVPKSKTPFLEETERIKTVAEQEGQDFEDIKQRADVNIEVMKNGAFLGWKIYEPM